MSAYIVNEAHIDALIDVAKQYDSPRSPLRWFWGNPARIERLNEYNPTELGRMLFAQNARSVGDRYNETPEPVALTYSYRPTGKLGREMFPGLINMTGVKEFTAIEAHSIIRGYCYQACETSDWVETEAYAFCEALKNKILDRLAPVDSDWWGVTDEQLGRVRCEDGGLKSAR